MATYEVCIQVDNYRWETINSGLSLKTAYYAARKCLRKNRENWRTRNVAVCHEEYGHVIMEFDCETEEIVYIDLN